MTHIFYSAITEPFGHQKLEACYKTVPREELAKILKFKRWKDAHLSLCGKLLLMTGLHNMGFPPGQIHSLRRDEFNKPYFDDGVFFNITHAGDFVVCAISTHTEVGIDIEHMADIEYEKLDTPWCDDERNEILLAANPIKKFYTHWTRKEAILKADGQGMSIPLKEVNTTTDTITLYNKEWHMQEIPIADEYICHLATRSPITSYQKEYVSL